MVFASLLVFACASENSSRPATGEGAARLMAVDADSDGFYAGGDCDDADAAIDPGALEECDGVDSNCDGALEPPGSRVWYFDGDGDSYGDAATPVCAVMRPFGATRIGLDCDDADAAIHPDVTEVCDDGVDSDCSGADSNGCDVELLEDVGIYYAATNYYDRLGYAVANAGDLDGDGRDDLAVGASNTGYVGEALPDLAGATYVVYGAAALAGSDDIDSAYGARIVGDLAWGQVGANVGGVGDLDGDGYDDLLVTSVSQSTCIGCGEVRAFLGPVGGELAFADGDIAVPYETPADFGTSVSHGDFDDDGQADLVVAAPWAQVVGAGDSDYDGAVYFLLGPLSGELDVGDAKATFLGDEGAYAGRGLSALADDDGDGVADIAIGAENENDGGGVVMLVHGPLDGDLGSASADVVYTTSHDGGVVPRFSEGDLLGRRCEWAGDLDGDGHLDLAMSALAADENGHDAGAVYVVYGPHRESLDIRASDAILYGGGRRNMLGYGLAEGKDLDADGFDDVIVGTSLTQRDGMSAVAAHVFYGPTYGRRAADSADLTFAAANGSWGEVDVDTLDFDGDGALDVTLGASDDDIGGRAYVVLNTAF